MLTNYLRLTLRHARTKPGYTLLNVGGLALGLASVFLIVLYLQHEFSYDAFHPEAESVYRIQGLQEARLAQALAPLPEVATVVRYWHAGANLRVGNTLHQASARPVDAGFFDLFAFPFVEGDPATALDAPNALVLTASLAQQLFGDASPLGQTVRLVNWANPVELVVTGVMADLPTNTHLRPTEGVYNFAALAAHYGRGPILAGEPGPSNFTLYLKTHPGVQPDQLEAKLRGIAQQYFTNVQAQQAGFTLQPLTTLYLSDQARRNLYAFGGIALLILLIACVNFMNLATARAAQRAREVGVRKTLGALRSQLIGQFLGESLLLSGVSAVLGIGLAVALLPAFGDLVAQPLAFHWHQHGPTALILVATGLAAGLLAGSYPALYLSAFRPARVLKGDVARGRGAARLRQGLIVGQFAISVFLLVGTFTVYQQVQYMKDRPLGFDQEQVVYATISPSTRARLATFTQELAAHPEVARVTGTNGVPPRFGATRRFARPQNPDRTWTLRTLFTDPQYAEVLGLELVAGRFFAEDRPSDRAGAMLLNETAAAQLELDDPLGQTLLFNGEPREVIGIVRDFHFEGLHQEIKGLALLMDASQAWYVAARLTPGGVPDALNFMQQHWAAFDANWFFNPVFVDEAFGRLYRQQERLGQLVGVFAGLAILVACLGLFGLAAFVTERRTKEIGVRKVFGASVLGLLGLLSWGFARLVLIGFAVAVPVAYLVTQHWLADFAYRIDVPLWVFAAAGLFTLLIALGTVCFHTLRASLADPIKSLRHE